MIFIDTNFFLRFLLNDLDEQHQKVKRLFHEGAHGEKELFSSTIVFFEVYWVLESFYEKDKSELVRTLQSILEMSFIKFEERKLLETAVKLFQESSINLEDAYNAAYARSKRASEFGTFDKKLLKVYGDKTR